MKPTVLLLVCLLSGCVAPPVGSRTSNPIDVAILTTHAVIAFPEMITPRDPQTIQKAKDSAVQGPNIPAGHLSPDLFSDR